MGESVFGCAACGAAEHSRPQNAGERRAHHQTREDRQRKVYGQLRERIAAIRAGRYYGDPRKLPVYEREAAAIEAKIVI